MYGGGTSSDNPVGDWSQRCITLSNTVDSEIAPCLPLPSLPVFCGAVDQELCLFDDQPRRPVSNRRDLLAQAGTIAELLRHTDVSYLDLKKVAKASHSGNAEDLDLCCEVLRYNPNAFEYNPEGSCREQIVSAVSERTPLRNREPVNNQLHKDHAETRSQQRDPADPPSSSRKLKVKKKANQENLSSTVPDPAEHQDVVLKRFCEAMEEFCGRAEVPSGDRDEAEWESMPISDIKFLVNEIMSLKAEKMLHLTPVEILTRVLKVLDHQVHNAEGLSADECQHTDSDVSLIFVALESIQAALAVMSQPDMPKQLYNEEIIERVLEFLRRQIMDAMSASDPSYRATHKPKENAAAAGDEDDDDDVDYGSASKKRCVVKSVKPKRTAANRVSAASSAIYQKLCTILGFLRDLLLMERLSDSCILQLLKTSLSTFLVDNIQLLQLKAISLISGIFYSYPQHRSHIMDEVAQLLWKLPVSKRVARTYHLPDEEQKQIQMVSALLLQMVHHSSNVPESLRNQLNVTAISEPRLDSDLLLKCQEATTETCVSFWTRVLQRFAAVKNQDASELKVIMDNLVSDLLTALNLPEYPASALLLEVLCVLLLQNAGPKSKDSSIRAMAIDLFGNIAARLKQDSSLCNKENFWMIQELEKADDSASNYPEDACSVCLDVRAQRSLVECHNCQRLFHADCIGVRQHDTSISAWNCPFCLSQKHLLLLQSYCKSQSKDSGKKSSESVPKIEILQQMLLNYLQDAGSADDLHLFTRWFYLCFWCKDDPKSEQKLDYHLARLKLKAIVRDSEATLLSRSSIKKISAFLGQKSSFCRGFDRILCNLLACLRENSPVVRAKALRAVSLIVEADPDVLCDKRVQLAVEGRFCDSAISAREAALELVGRHIASHPDVGLKYFEKIAERVKDTGVSVRKRAIKIIRDMCVSNDNFPEAIHACIEIISRVSDEESSIQDLVCKTFYEFWFEEPSGVQTQYFGDGSLVPSELAKKTEQIVDMLRKIPNHQPLVTVIKRNLALDFFPQTVKAAGINPVSLDAVHKRCELICKCLLEKILQVQEINDMEGEATMLPYVMALYAFCTVNPKLCAPASDPSQFIVTLQPYLKNQVDNRVAAKLLESIVFIIDAVLPYLRRLPTSIVEELEQDLKHIIIRHSFLTVVSAAIKCVCTVGKQAGKGAVLVELLILLFFKRLDATSDDKQQVGRSLFCLGLLIRHGNSLLSAFNKVVDFDSSLVLFKRYLLAEDFAIKVRALQALGYVLIAKPECMLENDVGKIVAATLSSNSNVRLKMQSLQNIYEYLLDAENQLQPDVDETNVVDYPVEGGGPTVPYAAGAGDTNICGGIVQLYWDKILERTLDIDEQVRQSALKIVEVVLRQGLVHPITCVPYLIALETDPEEMNSKLAHHLLINMNEKYPDFFESRLGDGLQLSFFFIQSMKENDRHLNLRAQAKGGKQVKEKPVELSISNARLGVSRIYKLIRGNRVGRHKFMSSVVRKFDNPQWSETVTPFLTYCAEILALLPFTTPDEPLYLIYIINRVIQVRSGTLEATMKALSTYFSNRGSQKVIYENGCNQQDTTAHLTSAYTAMELGSNMISFHQNIEGQLLYPNLTGTDEGIDRSDSGNSYILTEEDRHRIQAECIAAIAIQLLLKLKRHLKIVYNLDDVRCQAFSPAEIPKTGEALSKQSIPFNIGDMHTDLPSTSQELTQRYQEYKSALREDTVDYSAYSANIKRKRPPAARRGGGRGSRAIPSRSIPRDEDDDDDNDENWSRSAQRNTVQRSYNTRTRQF